MASEIWVGDCREVMEQIPSGSVHCVITSPPYWGQRDYGLAPLLWGGDPDCKHKWGESIEGLHEEHGGTVSTLGRACTYRPFEGSASVFCVLCGCWRGSLGLEPSTDLYVEHLVEVFRGVRRVLRQRSPAGTLWLNMGDKYRYKQLQGLPWRVALALQADGWWLRLDIVWEKSNLRPESVQDRPTKSHEYLLLLSPKDDYYYDGYAVAEQAIARRQRRLTSVADQPKGALRREMGLENPTCQGGTSIQRNRRSVWRFPSAGFKGPHVAVFPEKLVEPCILAGTSEQGCCPSCGAPWNRAVEKTLIPQSDVSPERGIIDAPGQKVHGQTRWGGYRRASVAVRTLGWDPGCECGRKPVPAVVMDPFAGSGTVGVVARRWHRDYILIDQNEEYGLMQRERIGQVQPLLLTESHSVTVEPTNRDIEGQRLAETQPALW